MQVTQTGIAVALAVAVTGGFFVFGTPFIASLTNSSTLMSTATTTVATTSPNTLTMEPLPEGQPLPTELTVTDIVVGTGAEAVTGSTVAVNYVGALANGTVFDASANHGAPFEFPLGAGMVIKGWDQGVVGMKVGGKRQLIIPADLAYGDQARGDLIPPNSTLIFEVELVDVK